MGRQVFLTYLPRFFTTIFWYHLLSTVHGTQLVLMLSWMLSKRKKKSPFSPARLMQINKYIFCYTKKSNSPFKILVNLVNFLFSLSTFTTYWTEDRLSDFCWCCTLSRGKIHEWIVTKLFGHIYHESILMIMSNEMSHKKCSKGMLFKTLWLFKRLNLLTGKT